MLTDIEFITVLGMVLVAFVALGALWVYHQLRRQWFDHYFEDLKTRQNHYLLFIHDLSQAASVGDDETHRNLMASLDGLLLIAPAHLIPKIMEFQKFMRVSNVRVLRNSEVWLEQRDEISRDLVQALRADVYGYEPSTADNLNDWRPLSRNIRKPGLRLEVLPFKLRAKAENSPISQQK